MYRYYRYRYLISILEILWHDSTHHKSKKWWPTTVDRTISDVLIGWFQCYDGSVFIENKRWCSLNSKLDFVKLAYLKSCLPCCVLTHSEISMHMFIEQKHWANIYDRLVAYLTLLEARRTNTTLNIQLSWLSLKRNSSVSKVWLWNLTWMSHRKSNNGI